MSGMNEFGGEEEEEDLETEERQQEVSSMLAEAANDFLRWATAMHLDVTSLYRRERVATRNGSVDAVDGGLVESCFRSITKIVDIFQQFHHLVGMSLSQALSDLVHKNLSCFRNLIQVEQILCNSLAFALLRRQVFRLPDERIKDVGTSQELDEEHNSAQELRLVRLNVDQCVKFLEKRLLKIRVRLDDTVDVIRRVSNNREHLQAFSTKLQILFLEFEEKVRLVGLDSMECEQKIDDTLARIKLAFDKLHLCTNKIVTLEAISGLVSLSVGVALHNFWGCSTGSSLAAAVVTFVSASSLILKSKRRSFYLKNLFEDHLKNRDYRRFLV